MTGKLDTAIDIMVREVEEAIEALNHEGAEAFKSGNYDKARKLMDRGPQLAAFREKVLELRREWQTLSGSFKSSNHKPVPEKKTSGLLSRSGHTPEDEFLIPILQALLRLNGSATIHEVMDLVEEIMGPRLNKIDFEPAKSGTGTGTLRWHHSIEMVRQAMVQEGLLSAATPAGILQITEEGKQWLAKQGIYS